MIINHITIQLYLFLFLFAISSMSFSQSADTISPHYKVTLPEAHIGNQAIDSKLLESYTPVPENIKQFFLDARSIFSSEYDVDFTDSRILKAAMKHHIEILGGPLLGNLKEDGVTLWLRLSQSTSLELRVGKSDGHQGKTYRKKMVPPGREQRIVLDGLAPATGYQYEVYADSRKIAEGRFTTSPSVGSKGLFKLAFGSDFHKIGLHNPNLIRQILKSRPDALTLLGDLAVDDRENRINMHRSDYLLRDLSKPWKYLAANVPIYSSWDDHDYLNNDLSGIPSRFTKLDREALRKVWFQNWNNPEYKAEGIYFNTRIGPVELIMLDTRSCRKVEERGKYGSFLGIEQQTWLKDLLQKSSAPFKIISSGTMWSDYISDGKDSWGTWDTLARKEIFDLIEKQNIAGVLFISGDRHGARSFTIPQKSGFKLHEFQAGTLGGVPGPEAMAKDLENQIFGYGGTDIIAFGEFIFDTRSSTPIVTFRLVDELGNILEEQTLSYSQLIPREK